MVTLSLKPLACDKPIHPSEMPRISTCTDTITDDTMFLLKMTNTLGLIQVIKEDT